jgi:hypothetical protein
MLNSPRIVISDDLTVAIGAVAVRLTPTEAFAAAERMLDRAARQVVIEASSAPPVRRHRPAAGAGAQARGQR